MAGLKLLRDFQTQTDKQVIANQPDIVVVNKVQRRAVEKDLAIPRDCFTKKEPKNLKIYWGLKEKIRKVMENQGLSDASGHCCEP